MSSRIVPVALGLTAGDLFTLWAPTWVEDGEEWEAFLGAEDDIFGFPSVPELVAFSRAADDHVLADHPGWDVVERRAAIEFEPTDDDSHDLVGLPEILAEAPTEASVRELDNAFAITRAIGDVCGVDAVTGFFDDNTELAAVADGIDSFYGRDGARAWNRIGTIVAKGWDDVLEAIEDVVTTPEQPAGAPVEDAAREYAEANENLAADEDDDEDDEYVDLDENLWDQVGIDPILIVTDADTYYSLRCFLDDDPVFLGDGDSIIVFRSTRALARFLVDDDHDQDHDLASVETFGEVVSAANGGDLTIEPTPENTYALVGLAAEIGAGPAAVDADKLDLAVELLVDAADYVGDDGVEAALRTTEALGGFVDHVTNPEGRRLAPVAPFDEEVAAWTRLVAAFEERLDVR